MVKRSIEQEIRNKNFGARSGNFEKNAVVENQGDKTECTKNSWRLLAMETKRAMCERETIAVSRHDMNKRGKSSPSNPSPNSFMRQK